MHSGTGGNGFKLFPKRCGDKPLETQSKEAGGQVKRQGPDSERDLGQVAQKFPAQVLDIISQHFAVSQTHFNRGTTQSNYLQAGFFN